MNDLLKTRLFILLNDPSQEEVTNDEMQRAYGNFVEHTKTVSDSADNVNVMRTLSFTRIELASLETVFWYEQEKKCPKESVSAKILNFS